MSTQDAEMLIAEMAKLRARLLLLQQQVVKLNTLVVQLTSHVDLPAGKKS
jgi:hypothetical protein